MLRLIGVIELGTNQERFSVADWVKSIEEVPDLRRISTCTVANPFTGEPCKHESDYELAAVLANEDPIIVFRWCEHGRGIDVFGEDKKRAIVERVASIVGGVFVEEQLP